MKNIFTFFRKGMNSMEEVGPHLGKLGLAILEHFVESKLGEKFVTELRKPTDRQIAITKAMESTADRLWEMWEKDERLWYATFHHLPDNKILQAELKKAVNSFYQDPTNTVFADVLTEILQEYNEFSNKTIKLRVEDYVNVLTIQMALADETFRENVRALSDLRTVRILEQLLDEKHTKARKLAFKPGLVNTLRKYSVITHHTGSDM